MRSVLIRATKEALQSSDRSLLLTEGRPSSHCAVASCGIRSDGPREAASLTTLRSSTLWQASTSSLASLPYLLLLSRPDSGGAGVTQWLVDLCAHPQTVQKHRKLPRHGHRRPLLGVLASAGGYLLSVAPEVRVRAKGAKNVVSA